MRGILIKGIGWAMIVMMGAGTSLRSEPVNTASTAGGRKPGLRQFRPLLAVQSVMASKSSLPERAEPTRVKAEKPSSPSFAGKSSSLNRIPPPPIPTEAETVSLSVRETIEPLSSDIIEPPIPTPEFYGPEIVEPPIPSASENSNSLDIIEPPLPGANEGDTEPLLFTPAGSDQGIEDYEGSPQPTYADIPPASEKDETVALVEEADQIPEPKPVKKKSAESSPGASSADGPTLSKLREEAHRLANQGLEYKFGYDNPEKGGLDCSGVVQHLLTKIGVKGVPRTSYDQYYWMRKNKTLDDVFGKKADQKLFKKLSPGDLIFWGNTWKSGHRVSHVMIYMGWNPDTDKHYIFGAQGRKSKGMLGNGVDIFELEPNRGRLIGHGKVPGLIYD